MRVEAEQPEVEEMKVEDQPSANACHSVKKRKLELGPKDCLSRGKRMVNVSLKKGKKNEKDAAESKTLSRNVSFKKGKKNEKDAAESKTLRRKVRVAAEPKSTGSAAHLREISAANLTRTTGARSVGSGTFGTCYPGKFRGIPVVIKEYKERSRTSLSFLQRQAKHEANVLLQLGDHPGIPLLFGVCLKEMPVCIVMKFHGDGKDSLTVYKAAKEKLINDQKHWNTILIETADSLDHVHRCGYVHNDLKSNNVVLEKREDEKLHPVIIDFGNSVLLSKARNPVPKPAHLRAQYKDTYIAPELVDGSGKPSIKSDIYALAFLVKTVYKISSFHSVAAVKKALVASPNDRPTVKELKAALSAK